MAAPVEQRWRPYAWWNVNTPCSSSQIPSSFGAPVSPVTLYLDPLPWWKLKRTHPEWVFLPPDSLENVQVNSREPTHRDGRTFTRKFTPEACRKKNLVSFIRLDGVLGFCASGVPVLVFNVRTKQSETCNYARVRGALRKALNSRSVPLLWFSCGFGIGALCFTTLDYLYTIPVPTTFSTSLHGKKRISWRRL